MFVTDELRRKVDGLLRAMEQRARWLQAVADRTDAWWADEGLCWGVERALQVAAELATDAANTVIDALVMREPGGYADILRVLMEEGVIDKPLFRRFEEVLTWRNRLVRQYASIPPQDLAAAVKPCAEVFAPYARALREYLQIR